MDKVRAKIGQRTVRLDFGAAGGNAVDYPVDVATGDAAAIGPLRHAGRNSRSGARFGERRRCRVALRAFQVVL